MSYKKLKKTVKLKYVPVYYTKYKNMQNKCRLTQSDKVLL